MNIKHGSVVDEWSWKYKSVKKWMKGKGREMMYSLDLIVVKGENGSYVIC